MFAKYNYPDVDICDWDIFIEFVFNLKSGISESTNISYINRESINIQCDRVLNMIDNYGSDPKLKDYLFDKFVFEFQDAEIDTPVHINLVQYMFQKGKVRDSILSKLLDKLTFYYKTEMTVYIISGEFKETSDGASYTNYILRHILVWVNIKQFIECLNIMAMHATHQF